MAWIESHQTLGRHPKLLRFAAKLRIHKAQAVGHLQYLWWWALDYAPTGDVSALTSAEISAAAEWPGEPDPFLAALRPDWIDADGMLHDWYEYAGKLIEERRKDRERKRVHRTSAGIPPDGGQTAAVPNPTQPNPTQPDSGGKPPGPHEKGDEEIYDAYPRKVGKEAALRAIRKARKKLYHAGKLHPGQYLLEKTQAYAKARLPIHEMHPEQVQYTPHPATWFNGGRYDDDPREWIRIYTDNLVASARLAPALKPSSTKPEFFGP